MSNYYCAIGPTLEHYQEMVKAHPPEVAIAHMRGMKDRGFEGTFLELKAWFQQNEMFNPTGAVYRYYVVDNNTKQPENEVYPAANWLNLMQKPRMHPLAIQESDMAFKRLMAPPPPEGSGQEDVTDNYVQMSVLWRGLEHRCIMQVMKPQNMQGMSEDTVIFRPEYLRIDPFLLMQLEPMPGVDRSDKAQVKAKTSSKKLPDNVASMLNRTPKK